MVYLGKLVIGELYGCDEKPLVDKRLLKRVMLEAASASKSTVIDSLFYQFSGKGISGVVVIAESHIAVHTWPEYGYAAVDAFTCGKHTSPLRAVKKIAEMLKAKEVRLRKIVRGRIDGRDQIRTVLPNAGIR